MATRSRSVPATARVRCACACAKRSIRAVCSLAEPCVDGIRKLADECVHCGFCLPSCPTYVLWGEEMDSPRGRIHLLTELLEEPDASVASVPDNALTPSVAMHFDRCLGCMACLTSCPSGVAYDRLIEDARVRVEEAGHRTLGERLVRELVFRTVPYPRRFRLALMAERLGRRLPLPGAARPLVALAPPWRAAGRLLARTPARGDSRGSVGILVGCVQRVVFGDVNAATAPGLLRSTVGSRRAARGRSRQRSEANRRVRRRRRRPDHCQRGRMWLDHEGVRTSLACRS